MVVEVRMAAVIAPVADCEGDGEVVMVMAGRVVWNGVVMVFTVVSGADDGEGDIGDGGGGVKSWW